MNEAFYLYCIFRQQGLPSLEGKGVDLRNPLVVYPYKDLAVLMSRISLAEFTGEAGDANLQDVAWLGPRALRHENIIEAVLRHAPLIPAPFGVVFSSLEKVDRLLADHYHTIREFLSVAADREEWSVKVFLDRKRVEEVLFAAALDRRSGDISRSSPGKHYFEEKKIRAGLESDVRERVAAVLEETISDLEMCGAAFRERRLLSREAAGKDMDMVLNGAFFVDRRRMEDFREILARKQDACADEGFAFELSGPWPPYSFSPTLMQEDSA